MIRLMTSLCMVLALLAVLPPAFAQDASTVAPQTDPAPISGPAPIGTLIAVEGQGNLILRASGDGTAIIARADDPVYLNDVVQSGPDARVLILLLDDSRFTLGANSRLRVDQYLYNDEDPLVNRAAYSVLQGTFLYVSGLIAKRDNPDIRIVTPYGSAGIRGTTLWGGMVDDEYGVFVDDGEITFETNRGRIRLTKGEGTTIRNANAIPERPKLWAEPKVTRAKATIALTDIATIKDRVTFHQQTHMALMAQHKQDTQAGRDKRVEELQSKPNQRRIDLKDLQNPASVVPAPNTAPTGTPEEEAKPTTPAPTAPSTLTTEPPAQTPALVPAPAMEQKPMEQQKTEMVAPPPTPAGAPAPSSAPSPATQGGSTADSTMADGFQLKAADEKPAADQLAAPMVEQPFPKPAQSAVTPNSDDLPADPAMRQEAIERMQLNNTQTSPAASGIKNPL